MLEWSGLGEPVGFGGRRGFSGHGGMMSVCFCLGLGRQKWSFSSDGGAGESWCGMLSSQTPTVPGFPRLKHEQIIPLSTHACLRGMLGVLPWVKCWDGFYCRNRSAGEAALLCCRYCRQTWHSSIPTGFVVHFQSKSHCLSS